MRLTTECIINGVVVELFLQGETSEDGEYVQINKIVVRLKNAELFRYENGEESGILMETDISEGIINSSINLLKHEQV